MYELDEIEVPVEVDEDHVRFTCQVECEDNWDNGERQRSFTIQ